MKILILKPSSLGDVVQALPVLRMIKLQHPQSQIFWWIASSLSSLLEGDPDLEGMFLFDRRAWSTPSGLCASIQNVFKMRKERFDWVIDLQGLARSGSFAWLANGRLTVGVEDRREGATMFYDRSVPRPTPETHAVDWYLEVARSLGITIRWDFDWLPLRPAAKASIADEYNSGRWVALVPGARWPNKRWPQDYFSKLVERLGRTHPDLRFVILGSNQDRAAAKAIQIPYPIRTLDLTGATSFPQLVEWLRLSDLIISNDTGPMHIAAALNKPLIALFGPTNPLRTGPYRQLHSVLQHPLTCVPCMSAACHRVNQVECLRGLDPDLVFEKASKRLGPLQCFE